MRWHRGEMFRFQWLTDVERGNNMEQPSRSVLPDTLGRVNIIIVMAHFCVLNQRFLCTILWKEKTKNGSVNVPTECRGTIERALAKDVFEHYCGNNAPVKV